MTSAYRQHHVYPGHPVMLALEIMDAFPDHEAAHERTEQGWPVALSHSGVSGSGGAVYQGLEILRLVHEGESTPEEAYDFAQEIWVRSRQSDFRENLERGVEEATALRDAFLSRVQDWVRSSRGEPA
jgi:hypothetical protein